MCGIAGYVGGFIPGLVSRMNSAQAHRGPDGIGVFEDPQAGAALGHVRLAILDLTERAAQPMYSPDGRYVIVYNGIIYNFAELREPLVKDGLAFKSTCDTEVLLRGLEHHGESFLEKLNGLFAFALWDRRERNLLLASDPIGAKPLYYAEPVPGTLLFASEIKAICAHPQISREPDFVALQQHLAFCHSSADRTALKGVKRLRPGTLLRFCAETKSIQSRRYWRPSFSKTDLQDRSKAVDELRESIREATQRQLVSDVPVGSFLSGGLDSSLITAFGASQVNNDFRCYTVTYPASEYVLDYSIDTAEHARNLARLLGLKLQELEIKPQVASLWPKLVYHLDEPIVDPAAIACYLISKLAKEDGTTVLLSGQGGDELFGGYPRYRAMHFTEWFEYVPEFIRRMLSTNARLLPGSREGQLGIMLRRTRRVLSELHQNPDLRFLAYCTSTPEHEIKRILSPEFRAELKEGNSTDECIKHINEEGLSGVDRFLERDMSVYLPNHNLLYTDKMAMAVGLEARVPLLDMALINLVTHYPADWKLARSTTKAILRDAARGIVPDAIINRPKAGFGAPYRKWLRYDLEDLWNDLTSEAALKRRGWFNYASLKEARERSQAGSDDLYMLQWAVLTIELWARQFIDRNPSAGS
jgi:asparagine synthase (glutamine-hydrolysing)